MIQSITFKSDNVQFNNPRPASVQNAQAELSIPDDELLLLSNEMKKMQKKEKSQERLQKMSAYGTVAIGVGLLGSFLLSIYAMVKSKGKSQAEAEMEKLTKATINWVDFKDVKGTVASLNAKTTSKVLRDAFNNILNLDKLSEKAKKWSGQKCTNTNMIYLYGHGGVGKTYVAKQFAQEMGALFTSIKYPDMGSPFKDAASMKVSNTFDQIVEIANKYKDRQIVVCIDEFDAVIKKISPISQNNEADKTRAAVLTGMDAVREKCENVTFIATSNYHPKNGQVDEIALRRFNNQIEVPLPDKEQIEGLLEMYLKNEGAAAINDTGFIKSAELKKFAKKLGEEGFSNGEIELIAKEAVKIFRSTLKDAKDAELETKHKFKIDYLEQALKMKGTPASKTNRLMDVLEPIPKDTTANHKKPNFWQRLKFLFNI